MRFICGLQSSKHRKPCSEWFDTFEELADHLNLDHRLCRWIAGGTITQDDLRSDHMKQKEILKWPSTPSQPFTHAK